MKSYGRRTPIILHDVNSLVKEYQSIKEAAFETNVKVQNISNNLRGLTKKTSAGIFLYKPTINLPHETWLVYPHDTRFKVSNLGRMITPSGKLSQVCSMVNGYLRVRLLKGSTSIHRMVATCFVDNPENKDFVNHLNGLKTDNRAENLEWCTHKENMQHAENIVRT